MRAVVIHELGAPEVLVPVDDWPGPVAGPGEVVVDVELANVTFVETQVRAGRPPNPAMLPELPAVLGNGVGGVVASVGPEVDDELVGRRVVSSLSGTGGYAAQARASADALVPVPDDLDMADAVALLADAVALLADGRTALGLMRSVDIRAGDRVLVPAAAGGVGSLLVQLATAAGGSVVALASSERKLSLAQELGAQLTVTASPGWSDQVRTKLGRVDVVFDGVGGDIGREGFELLAAGGRFVPFGMASGSFAEVSADEAADRQVTVTGFGPMRPAELRGLQIEALAKAAAGEIQPIVGQTFPLEQAAKAHALMEARSTLGKTLLQVV